MEEKKAALLKRWIHYYESRPHFSQLSPEKVITFQKKHSKTGSWNTRKVALQGNCLFYFTEASDFKGVIFLKDCQVEGETRHEDMDNVIVVRPKYSNRLLDESSESSPIKVEELEQKYYFSCPTKTLMNEWLKVLELASKLTKISDEEVGELPGLAEDEGIPFRTTSLSSVLQTYQIGAISLPGKTQDLLTQKAHDLSSTQILLDRIARYELQLDMYGKPFQ